MRNKPRLVFWGTFDTGKPRVRLLLQGVKNRDVLVSEVHANVWSGIEDKSLLKSPFARAKQLFRWVIAYPTLLFRYLRLPPHAVVICTYPGIIDVLVLAMFARIKRVPLVWDIFISVYDTIVIDREMVSRRSPAALLLYSLEWLACRLADVLIMDTAVHATAMEHLFHLHPKTVQVVQVGCEDTVFHHIDKQRAQRTTFNVLFYGQFIPLHGIDIIVRAMKHLQDQNAPIVCKIIGKGQEQKRIDDLLRELNVKNVQRIAWVPYEELPSHIHEADACLGIFRGKGKATRVIPNKAYQILAVGGIFLTGDTPAARNLLGHLPHVRLVPPENPQALAEAILDIRSAVIEGRLMRDNEPFVVDAQCVGQQFLTALDKHFPGLIHE